MSFRARPGARLDDYEIVTELGRGGMGQVLLARDSRVGRSVALKILPPECADDDEMRARFMREARIAANLEHVNVVPVYDIGVRDDLLYIAMRYIVGKDLRDLLRDGPIDPTRALAILLQIASALDAAHAAGLIHRDVKPGNILLTEPAGPGEPEHAYLADFGLATQTVLSDIHTTPGTILGTIDYAPPEQLEGRPVDARADVYALGAVLFESLTGTPPFQRPSPVATIAAIFSEPAPRPSAVGDGLPAALDDVTAQALAKSREDRFGSCLELIVAARDAIAGVAGATLFVPGGAGEIPAPLNSFIGRTAEAVQLRNALRAGRLVTLTGPGGAGKTRLAIEVAHALQTEGTSVSYIDLAGATPGEIAARIGDGLAPPEPQSDGTTSALVVLDDCERHIEELAPLLEALLAERTDLVVLLTSREPLGARGERTVLLDTLALPAPGSPEKILDTPAGQLFWERSIAVDPSLEPNASTLRAVDRICRELDGIPLAIELAASRVRGLPLEEIADRIVKRPDLIADSGAPERRRTMSAAISWSYDLLSDAQRQLFCRLGVFAGTFTLEDVEVVCAEGLDDAADGLAGLVERSLVVMRRDRGSAYRLLGPIARFAHEQLADGDEADRVRARHAEWFLAPFLSDSGESALHKEHFAGEARAALRWIEEHPDPDPALQELAGRAAAALGAWREAVALLEPLIDDGGPRVLETAGVALCKVHRDEPAHPAYLRGQELLTRTQELDPNSRTLSALAGTWKGVDDERAHALYASASTLDPSDPYALGNLLEYEVAGSGSLDAIEPRRAQIDLALERCRSDADAGRNLPWAYYDEGQLLALLGRTMPSLHAYLRALLASEGRHPLETSRRSLERVAGALGAGTSVDLAMRLLSAASAVQLGSRDGIERRMDVELAPPVLIFVGNSSAELHDRTMAHLEPLADALAGFKGTLIGGGTTTGTSALVAALTTMLPDATSIGYLPAVLPSHAAVDARCSEIRPSDGHDFGPAEPLAYWHDLLARDVAINQVAVLGIGGGEIAAFEYRLALALGAWAGMIRETGRASAELLADPIWSGSRRLFEVATDAGDIRRFLIRVGAIVE